MPSDDDMVEWRSHNLDCGTAAWPSGWGQVVAGRSPLAALDADSTVARVGRRGQGRHACRCQRGGATMPEQAGGAMSWRAAVIAGAVALGPVCADAQGRDAVWARRQ